MVRIFPFLVFALLVPITDSHPRSNRKAEVLWDNWGVPHITARDERQLFHALGWVRMEAHAERILRAYGTSRGRAAEYWGRDHLESDRMIRRLGIPARAAQWKQQQRPPFSADLKAFVSGLNTWVRANEGRIDPDLLSVMPLTVEDVLAHMQRCFHFAEICERGIDGLPERDLLGSNAWALSRAKTAHQGGLLMANPHLPFDGVMRIQEVHLSSRSIDLYGGAVVGLPIVFIGFNRTLGWTHTDNGYGGNDYYELTLEADGYRFGEEVLRFEEREETLHFERRDGSRGKETLSVRSSIHGPVMRTRGGRALAIRTTGLDRPFLLEQYWQMATSRDLSSLGRAWARAQNPRFSLLATDDMGNIFYHFGGLIPERDSDAELRGALRDGADPQQLWRRIIPHDRLPNLTNPPSGWLQNCNDPPWFVTGTDELLPHQYPRYLSPQSKPGPRAIRSREMLAERPSITFEDVLEMRYDSRLVLADLYLPSLLEAAQRYCTGWGLQARDLLSGWNRSLEAESRGGPVFVTWLEEMKANGFDLAAMMTPGRTPVLDEQIAAACLDRAARRVFEQYGAVGVPWGDVYRLRGKKIDLPANGGPRETGSFHMVTFARDHDKRFRAVGGDSFSFVVSLGNRFEARVLNVPGNAGSRSGPHHEDQLPLLSRTRMRKALLDREDILEHLGLRETVPRG